MLRLIETYNGVKIEVELKHPEIGSDYVVYVVEDDGKEDYKGDRLVAELCKIYKDSVWHEMDVAFIYNIDGEVYKNEYKDISFYSFLEDFEDENDDFEDVDMDDFEDMMPCDYNGTCNGMNCKNYLNCKGGR